MFILSRDGDTVNRALKEFVVDSEAALNEIPQKDYSFGAVAVVITDSAIDVYMANADKKWIKA